MAIRGRPGRRAQNTSDEPIQVVMVSGFLGAGKTTALKTMGKRLSKQGRSVGMITNDQASGLVDTAILEETDATVAEIPGGCFCCNFKDLLRAAYSINEHELDVLLAEPVGSCTDIVATVINPLRSMHSGAFSVAPLTTILDPDRVGAYLSDEESALPEAVRYIFRKQVAEGDVIVLNKIDTLTDEETAEIMTELTERVGDRPVIPVSVERQENMETWMKAIFDGREANDERGTTVEDLREGRPLTDIDYDTYAEGEARLGWVNLTATLTGSFEVAEFRADLMDRVHRGLRTADIEIAHLKFSISASTGFCQANLTSTESEPSYDGATMGTVDEAQLVLNARAVGDPDEIRAVACDAITNAASPSNMNVVIEKDQAFRPDYPEPVYRLEG